MSDQVYTVSMIVHDIVHVCGFIALYNIQQTQASQCEAGDPCHKQKIQEYVRVSLSSSTLHTCS